MKPSILLLALFTGTALSQAQAPLGGNAARPPTSGTSGGAAGGSAGTGSGGDAAKPPSGGSGAGTGGDAARPPSGGSGAATGGDAAKPPSAGSSAGTGGNAARPPSGGSGVATGGNAARPPNGGTPGQGSQVNLDSYSCPGDNGKRYTTGGVTFELKCNQGTTAKRIQNQPCYSQKQCADLCAADPRCQSSDWNIQLNSCATFSEYIPTIDMTGVNTWFPIKKRKDPEPPSLCPVQKPLPGMDAMMANITDGVCRQADGKLYVSPDGTYFKIVCGYERWGPPAISSSNEPSLPACMNKCSQTLGCKSVSYLARPFNPGTEAGGCQLHEMGEDIPPTRCGTPLGQEEHDFAVVIDPPTVPSPPQPVQKRCATECPDAHGRIFTASNGETYLINCCARHATTPLPGGKVHAETMEKCLESCAAHSPCSAVDFHSNTASCYLLDRKGPATLSTKMAMSAFSLGCAGACKSCGCGGSVAVDDRRPNQGHTTEHQTETTTETTSGAEKADPPKPPEETCPGLDGQVRTYNGIAFQFSCTKGIYGNQNMKVTDSTGIVDCARQCAETPGCHGADRNIKTGKCYMKADHVNAPAAANSEYHTVFATKKRA